MREIDPFSPGPEYRLLVQNYDIDSEREMAEYIERTFGHRKIKGVVLIKGSRRFKNGDSGPLVKRMEGYRAYIPRISHDDSPV